jgi:hypothetical protein
MPTEMYANNASTTLSAAISSTSATSCSVASSSGFPVATNVAVAYSNGYVGLQQFRVLIDSEILIVVNISGTTWTITRGVEDTAAATHASGATVTMLLTGENVLATSAAVATGANPHWYGVQTWTCDFMRSTSSVNFGTTGYVNFFRVPVLCTMTITKGTFGVTTAATTATAGQNFLGLYSSTGTLLTSAPIESVLTTTGVKTVTFGSAQTITGGLDQSVIVAILFNGTGTAGLSALPLNNGAISQTSAKAFLSSSNGQTALPSTIVLGSGVGNCAAIGLI